MKKITITNVENGFIVEVTSEGLQSLFDRRETFVAKSENELVELVKKYAGNA
tara:strand:+ start:1167 stop:1322 length:156 start_codon:yes stop_codon:yes gene_type:complete